MAVIYPNRESCVPYEPNRHYACGAVVTSDGQSWIAQRATSQRPGAGGDWKPPRIFDPERAAAELKGVGKNMGEGETDAMFAVRAAITLVNHLSGNLAEILTTLEGRLDELEGQQGVTSSDSHGPAQTRAAALVDGGKVEDLVGRYRAGLQKIPALAPMVGSMSAIAEIAMRSKQKISLLEKRVLEVEARPEFRYLGTHQEGATYSRGDAVTHRGSVWSCKGETTKRPGDAPDAWTLMVKRGADGKDMR